MTTTKRNISYVMDGQYISEADLHTVDLIDALDKDKFEPVVAVRAEGLLTKLLSKHKIDWYKVGYLEPMPQQGKGTFFNMRAIIRNYIPVSVFLRAHKTALVHIAEFDNCMAWVLPVKMLGRKLVIEQHNSARPNYATRFFTGYAKAIVTHFVKIRNTVPKGFNKITHLFAVGYNPNDKTPTRNQAKKDLLKTTKHDKKAAIIGFVGTSADRDRAEIFVRMAGRLAKQTQQKLAFFMWGEHTDESWEILRETANRNGIRNQITRLRCHPPLYREMAGCDILVAPAIDTGTYHHIASAMAAGTPVVCVRSGALGEIVLDGETGLVTNPDNPKELANAVASLLDDKDKAKKLATSARQWIENDMDMGESGRQMQQLYAKLLRME